MPAKAEIKYGFYVGLGLVGALILLGVLQALTLRAVARRNG
jgi:hypothetical protein